ncbi:light-harvesting complex-like protein OHP2, chloroplastic [Lycium ferocissimum]|uniref:light-harvesting complex-like protein OHP2, chloroplastic n=1 Tax=Lycium ferocissimum TaxID=112874 RepID=UPI00281526FC|nr:light-harvesting complex-like protein OHP2, chloroplastic [Lycium ferocissimum]
MSVASSSTFPCIKIQNYPSSSSSSSCYTLRFCTTNPTILTIRNSQAEGPFRRPVAPSPPKPNIQPPSSPPPPPPPSSTTNVPPKNVAVTTSEGKNVITLEFQRQKAKELQGYFKQKKLEEANQGPFFGFIAKNEISNGRWAMFGFAVGMLTEYATGSDFVDQVKILLSNFGIVDLE